MKTAGVIIKPVLLLRDPLFACRELLEQENLILHYLYPVELSLCSQSSLPSTVTHLQGVTAAQHYTFSQVKVCPNHDGAVPSN